MSSARKAKAPKKKRDRRAVTDVERAEIVGLLRRKIPATEIGQKFDRHESTIYYIAEQAGLKKKPRSAKHNLKDELAATNNALHQINNGPPDLSQIDEQIQKLLEMASMNGQIAEIHIKVYDLCAEIEEYGTEDLPLK